MFVSVSSTLRISAMIRSETVEPSFSSSRGSTRRARGRTTSEEKQNSLPMANCAVLSLYDSSGEASGADLVVVSCTWSPVFGRGSSFSFPLSISFPSSPFSPIFSSPSSPSITSSSSSSPPPPSSSSSSSSCTGESISA